MNLRYTTKTVCITAFAVHSFLNVWSNTNPRKKSVENGVNNLAKMHFPAISKVSISPAFNLVRLKQLGFNDETDYFEGINQGNSIDDL